jgi:sugar O-acyltransferase (sialic acid O-acetyltransferase NeuD family)
MRVVVIGAGGHARSVIEALRSRGGDLEPVACTDRDPALANSALDGVPVVGNDDRLPGLLREGVEGACVGIGGTGDNEPRARVHTHLRSLGFALPPVVHATAHVAASASLGAGTQVLAGAIVGAGAAVGDNVLVNTGAIVEHDCWIGDHVHLATGCALGGDVHVDAEAHVGIGACVLQGVEIGMGSVVGAGAVVVRSVPAGQVAVGCPASALVRKGYSRGADGP